MGYESKIIIVNRVEPTWSELAFAEVIAEFKLCCVGYEFKEAFTEPIDFELYVGDTATQTDCYGELCKMADVDDVINALEALAKKESYRRFAPAIGLLKGFNVDEWDDLKVVHYGY